MSKKKEVIWRSENFAIEKRKKKLHWMIYFLIVADLCAAFCFTLAYSNFGFANNFKSWLVTTALGTGKHKYLAYILYNEETVKMVAEANTMIEPGGISNIEDIQFVDYSTVTEFENPYEEQILTKDPDNDNYKIIKIKENGYAGYICVIYHPEKLNVALASRKYGDLISTIAKREDATVAINCSGFKFDKESRYMIIKTDFVKDGKVVYSFGKNGYMIGMNENGVLMLRRGSGKDAVNDGMKWAVSFGPFLIVNGEPAQFKGNSAGGYEPRTAIGQRKDGVVLLVVIDGRGCNGSKGITYNGLVDIFTRYGCYNAANLDGGGSSTLVVKNKVINTPCDSTGERYNVAAIIYKP